MTPPKGEISQSAEPTVIWFTRASRGSAYEPSSCSTTLPSAHALSGAALLDSWPSRICRLIAGHIGDRRAEFGCHRFQDARGDRKAVLAPTFAHGPTRHVR